MNEIYKDRLKEKQLYAEMEILQAYVDFRVLDDEQEIILPDEISRYEVSVNELI